ncbi:MAG: hypothetical protein IJ899_15995 [Blautia sp.]|nr:hypothetical protein [Blautia sp.]
MQLTGRKVLIKSATYGLYDRDSSDIRAMGGAASSDGIIGKVIEENERELVIEKKRVKREVMKGLMKEKIEETETTHIMILNRRYIASIEILG